MVNTVSSTNIINQIQQASQAADVKNLVKYLNNESLKEIPDTFVSTAKSTLGFAGIFEGIPFLKYILRNKKIAKITAKQASTEAAKGAGKLISNNMRNIDAVTLKKLQNISAGNGSFLDKILGFFKTTNNAKNAYQLERSAAKVTAKNSKKITNLTAAIEKAGKTTKKGQKLTEKLSKIENKIIQAQEGAKNAANAISAVETVGKSAGKLAKVKDFLKHSGAKFMLIFSGIMECATEVFPTFKELGFKSGIKQLGKSAVKVAGDTFGFIAGEQIGTAMGTAIGTALFPGVGSAIGAVAGMVCGSLGSFVMGKLTKKITGKTEREKAKEEIQNQQVIEYTNNAQAQMELRNMAKEKLMAESANGKLSEDAQLALQSIQNLEGSNPFIATV